MGIDDKAMVYRRLCWDTYPETYVNINPLIKGELLLSNFDAAIKYSIGFFSLAPKNPTAMQDLCSLYDNPAYTNIFHKVIGELKSQYHHSNEALGNISFHYGLYLQNVNDKSAAIEQLKLARQLFSSVDKKHYVIKGIDELLKDVA